ncbi:MAG: CSLREA domain-containing protein [Deltaproteobacteria bacterium]|nr:MAG: CSLREA domain-containing protein [Deltaproteobacteria bacterium]
MNTTVDEYDTPMPNTTCSLREAIESVNISSNLGGCTNTGSDFGQQDTILLIGGQSYTLTQGLLLSGYGPTPISSLFISHSLLITTTNNNRAIISGTDTFTTSDVIKIFSDGGPRSDVKLEKLDIRGGLRGLYISSACNLFVSLENSVITQNRSHGIYLGYLPLDSCSTNAATLLISKSSIYENNGIGIFARSYSTSILRPNLYIQNSSIFGNTGTSLYVIGVNFALWNSIITANTSNVYPGIVMQNSFSSIKNSIISNNNVSPSIATGSDCYMSGIEGSSTLFSLGKNIIGTSDRFACPVTRSTSLLPDIVSNTPAIVYNDTYKTYFPGSIGASAIDQNTLDCNGFENNLNDIGQAYIFHPVPYQLGCMRDTNCDIGPVEAICPDFIVMGNETCDDGNSISGDGCSATCQREGTGGSSGSGGSNGSGGSSGGSGGGSGTGGSSGSGGTLATGGPSGSGGTGGSSGTGGDSGTSGSAGNNPNPGETPGANSSGGCSCHVVEENFTEWPSNAP